jgi:AhpD family alkylhydroperoxidase
MAQHLVKYLKVESVRHSVGSNRKVFVQMQLENAGVHGPFLIHAAQPKLLAALWALFRETQLASGIPRTHLETLALLIAQDNRCPWCIEAHQVALHTHGIVPQIEDWHRANPDPIHSTSSQSLLRIASLCWQYINRMTNVFLVESAWQRFGTVRHSLQPLMGKVFATFFLGRKYPAGRSLGLIEPAPLPEHLQWAASAGASGQALAYFHQTVQALGEGLIAPRTREVVLETIRRKDSLHFGLSRRWADEAVAVLEPSEQVLAKVLLLAALASHQIDENLMQALQATFPQTGYQPYDEWYSQDANILAVVAWGCYAPFLV